MPQAATNGIRIEYETFGSPSDRPLLLIIGLGGQLLQWDETLCRDFAARGHYVIRYDNRDAGLSTHFDAAGEPDFKAAFAKIMAGDRSVAPYTLEDMADDAAGLLDALKIQTAHVCGMSMGGMIAQTLAIRHPARVKSLISIYSSTGNPRLPQPRKEVLKELLTPAPPQREDYIEHMLRFFRLIAGPAFPFDEEKTRHTVAAGYDRAFYNPGVARQILAILAQKDRTEALSFVKTPTLVIHGTKDPLVPVEAGKAAVEAIPGAEMMLIEGMGHDLPLGGAWPEIVKAITAHTRRADSVE